MSVKNEKFHHEIILLSSKFQITPVLSPTQLFPLKLSTKLNSISGLDIMTSNKYIEIYSKIEGHNLIS